MKKYYLIAIMMGLITLLTNCQQFPGVGAGVERHASADSTITASVNAAMINNNQLAGIPIQVSSEQGMVQLSGYVKTIRQSDVAGDIASKVPGVRGVQNNLIVRK